MDGGAWWAVVHGVAKSQTRLSDFTLTFHFSLSCTGEGNGNPLQCSCLENPREGGAWWAAVCGVAQSRTRLKWLSSILVCSCKLPKSLPAPARAWEPQQELAQSSEDAQVQDAILHTHGWPSSSHIHLGLAPPAVPLHATSLTFVISLHCVCTPGETVQPQDSTTSSHSLQHCSCLWAQIRLCLLLLVCTNSIWHSPGSVSQAEKIN